MGGVEKRTEEKAAQASEHVGLNGGGSCSGTFRGAVRAALALSIERAPGSASSRGGSSWPREYLRIG